MPADCSINTNGGEPEKVMTSIGNHMKFNVNKSLRDRVRSFYMDVLQCTTMPSPAPNLDLYLIGPFRDLEPSICYTSSELFRSQLRST